MLQIRDICKEYRTGSLVQKALNQVSLNLRDNEFVAILGPSGSGKTTLLNIIGGLDRYDSGDLIINGISTKKYKDRDWDSYRNHTIGFVFQSYNLIPHQTILSNVELALTISGIGKSERRERAKKALEQVGLGEQAHKKPNQLSGGQMQRVAIARALVNDPEILLADEPTGALDSETSVQVMELLKEVARDRLVVMVTHNPELAHEYATRIVNLKDGKIRSDSDPFMVNEQELEEPEHKNMGKASMSFLTALSLSFNNLKTKKARTLLTSFAGSIGIIGIALILALSTGVNDYIKQIEEETLSEYPLQIQSTGVDFSSMIESGEGAGSQEKEQGDIYVVNMVTDMFSTMDTNDLESLKTYLDSGNSGIEEYTNAIEYSYNTEPQIYKENGDEIRQVHPDSSFSSLGLGSSSNTNSMMSSMMSTDVFFEMPENEELYEGQYDIKAGRWPENSNECVLVLTQGGAISDFMLYTLGLRDPLELDEMVSQFLNEEDITVPDDMGSYDYDDIIGINFKLVNSADYYAYDSQYQVWTDKSGDHDYVKGLVENGEDLTIVGVVQPSEDANASALSAGICYPASLTKHMSEYAEDTEIVKQQLSDPSVNVFTGDAFGEESSENTFDMESLITVDEEKLQEAFGFDESAFSNLSDSFDFSSVFGNAGDSVDLSGMVDLSGINISLPETGTMDLGEMLGNLDISISSEGFAKMAESLMEGYQLYVKDHPEADCSGLLESFQNYLTSDSAKSIMKESVVNIIKESGAMKVSSTELSSLFAGLQNDFAQSVEEQSFENADEFYSALITFMQGDPAVSAFNNFLEEKLDGVTVSDDQMTALAQEIMKGYYDYAQEGNGPDPSKIGEYFLDYLQTEDAQNRLAEGLAGTVDMGNVESQLTQVVENYMRNAMSSYGNAVSQALSAQISSAMQQMMSQLAGGMGTAMSQLMAK